MTVLPLSPIPICPRRAATPPGLRSGRISRILRIGLPFALIPLAQYIPAENLAFDKWNPDYRVWTTWWEPYSSDQDTVGLFHLDKGSAGVEKDVEKEMTRSDETEKKDPEAELLKTERGGGSAGNVVDSGPQSLNAETAGPVQWLAEGRFGGGLRLQGRHGCLVTAAYPDVKGKKDATVDFWFRPEASLDGVLCSLDAESAKPAPAIEWRVTPDGRISVQSYGLTLGSCEVTFPKGKWTHVATGWALDREPRLWIRTNGGTPVTFSHPKLASFFSQLSGVVRIGNNAKGSDGLDVSLDEVRVSNMQRRFYPLDRDWVDPECQRPIEEDQPYLRDRKDLLFAVSFDETIVPTVAAAGTQGRWGPEPAGNDWVKKTPDPDYRHGVRGRSILVGPGLAQPIWPGQGHFQPDRGAIELWVFPFDWDNRKKQGFQDPLEHVPVLRVLDQAARDKQGNANEVLAFGFYHKRPMEEKPPPDIEPGHWYHIVGNYDRGRVWLFLNGQPMPGATVYFHVPPPPKATTPTDFLIHLDPIHSRVNYHGEKTLIDELRFYSRPLTPAEAWNAYARYRPEKAIQPIPFAHTEISLNVPLKTFSLGFEMLGPKRADVDSVSAEAYGPEQGEPYVRSVIRPIDNGRGSLEVAQAEVRYGAHRIELTFLDRAGNRVDRQTVNRDHPRPPWLGCTVGVTDKVLPGWDPMRAEGKSICFWGREVVIGGSGLPERIVSQGKDLLASPIQVITSAGDQAMDWRPGAAEPRIEKATDTLVVTSGTLTAGDWELATRISTEYDGLMKVECKLSGKRPAPVRTFRLEIPLRAEHARLLGYWSGEPNFRAATWHGLLPEGQGVLLASHKLPVSRNPQLRGSFMPQVFLGDDERGIEWIAENDQGWNKSTTVPAVEVVRQGDVVTLRLNIIHQDTEIQEPRTWVFGLQPTPVKALPQDFRSTAKFLNFGFCDSFSTQCLKTDEGYANFAIFPVDYDWEAAERRRIKHAEHYHSFAGYEKPFLYIDRNWVFLPPNASEYTGMWYSSGYYRYLPEARDCYVWNIDQWLRHKIIAGIYIDDAWVGCFKDPRYGLAYIAEDGQVQPGFEFFDYHELMKRLRWAFVENGRRPSIWVHMTHTLFTPCLSFSEYILDGEDRFPNWGVSWDFMDAWPLGRLRYNSGLKRGLVPTWFIKIGNDQQPATPMPHWQYRQSRAYTAATVLNDIIAAGVPSEIMDEVYVDDGRFVGYWSPESPARPETPGICASFWLRPGKTIGIVVNTAREALSPAALLLDLARLGFPKAAPADLLIEDIDRFSPPKGTDLTRLKTPNRPDADAEATATQAEGDDFFSEVEQRDKKEELAASGKFLFDERNFLWKGGRLELLVRGHDYRILRFSMKPEARRVTPSSDSQLKSVQQSGNK